MSRLEQEEAKLDEDFVFYISFATPPFQHVAGRNKSLCEAWLCKLCAEPATGLAAKKVRNAYMFNLVLQLQERSLKNPFTSMPPAKLKPADDIFPPDKPYAKEPRWLQALAQGTGADLLHSSEDGRMYMTSRYLDDRRGAMTYLAISTADKEPLFIRPGKAASTVDARATEKAEESSSSSYSTCSEKSNLKETSSAQRKKSGEGSRATVHADAPRSKHVLSRRSRAPAEKTRKPRPTTFSSAINTEMESMHPKPDPSTSGEPPMQAKMQDAKPNAALIKMPMMRRASPFPVEGVAEENIPKKKPSKIVLFEKFLGVSGLDLPAAQREAKLSKPTAPVKVDKDCSHSRVDPADKTKTSGLEGRKAKTSGHELEVAVSLTVSAQSLRQSSKSDEASSQDLSVCSGEGENNSDKTQSCSKASSMEELFAKHASVTKCRKQLLVFDKLIQHTSDVLAGRDAPSPTLTEMLRTLGLRYAHLANTMPAKSRPLWLLKLLRERLITQRAQFVMRMTSLESAVQAESKKKLSSTAASVLWRSQFNAEGVDPAWRAEVCRMPTPQNMKRLNENYHPALVSRFLYHLMQEKASILNRHKSKLAKKEQLLKDELKQELKAGYENYNLVCQTCEEVKHIGDRLKRAAKGANVKAERQKDQRGQHQMERRYAAMARDIQEQLDKATVTLEYEKLRSQQLCDMMEAEHRKMEQLNSTFQDSRRRKEAHRRALEQEVALLGRDIEARSHKIANLRSYL